MRTRLMLALSVAVLAAIAVAGFVQATPGSGVVSTVFGIGNFDSIEAKSKTDVDPSRPEGQLEGPDHDERPDRRPHPREQDRAGRHVRLALPSRTEPVVVKVGSLTLYRADDPTCTGRVVQAGSGFVDNGGDIHVVRNEGSVETIVYVASLVPEGFTRRIDEPAPASCGF